MVRYCLLKSCPSALINCFTQIVIAVAVDKGSPAIAKSAGCNLVAARGQLRVSVPNPLLLCTLFAVVWRGYAGLCELYARVVLSVVVLGTLYALPGLLCTY